MDHANPVCSTIILSKHYLISSAQHSCGSGWTLAAPFYRCETWGSEFTGSCKVPRDHWYGQDLRPGFLFWSPWTPSANDSPLDISKLCTKTVCTDTHHFEHKMDSMCSDSSVRIFRVSFTFDIQQAFYYHSHGSLYCWPLAQVHIHTCVSALTN